MLSDYCPKWCIEEGMCEGKNEKMSAFLERAKHRGRPWLFFRLYHIIRNIQNREVLEGDKGHIHGGSDVAGDNLQEPERSRPF